MTMRGQKIHVRSRIWPDRLLCGRIDAGEETVDLHCAESIERICEKCRQQLVEAIAGEAIANAPRPAGFQYSWVFN
jgi:hypothetical protein